MTSSGSSALAREILIEFESEIPYTMDNIPGKLSKRVFIGGSYRNIAVLREISRMVLEKGYQPILASNFVIPRDNTRPETLRLLAACKFAIFEISFRDGHTIEIEKTKEFNINTLLVYQIISTEDSIDPEITSMIDMTQYKISTYKTFKELENIIDFFFLFN